MMQQKSAGRNSPYVQVSQTPLQAPIPTTVPLQPVQQPDVLASILPAVAQEKEVQGRVAALFNQIHRHVEIYYRDVHASITPSMEPELIRFGAMDVNMAELLQDCSSPTTALKHALVAYIIGISSPKRGDSGETLFPEELNGLRSRAENGFGPGMSSFLSSRVLHTLTMSAQIASCPRPTRYTAASPSSSTTPLILHLHPNAPGLSSPTFAKPPSISALPSFHGRTRAPTTRKRKTISRV
jgi:hypothetical protein